MPYRTLLAVCEGPAVLHRVRALQVRLSRSPPPRAELVTRGEALPAVRELTLIDGGKHGGLDLTWLDDTPLVSRLERLAVVTAFDALGALQLRWWLSLLARHPALGRVELTLGKLLDFELRREDGEPALRVVMSRLAIERIMLSESSELPTLLGQALTAVEPYELPLVRVDSPASWFGDELAALARTLRAHFGPSIRLPRLQT